MTSNTARESTAATTQDSSESSAPAKSNSRIRIGIVGYGNLGRGTELAIAQSPDMELAAVFTRRDPTGVATVDGAVPVMAMKELQHHKNALDVLVLCGGSRQDLPRQSPELARHFSLVDSFDTHARVPEHFAAVDSASREGQNTALISAGWDPGLFSIQRVYAEAVLPHGRSYTFWGPGLSQGHSDAIRRVAGVEAGVQYTIPVAEVIDQIRGGEQPELTTRQKHRRECWVVLKAGADADSVREAIVTMPDYFAEYDTTVNFISAQEMAEKHHSMPHGGFVLRTGHTSETNSHVVEYRLQLDSNPEFTASVLVAYARAVHRLNQSGDFGAKTVFDVPPGLLSPLSAETLRQHYL